MKTLGGSPLEMSPVTSLADQFWFLGFLYSFAVGFWRIAGTDDVNSPASLHSRQFVANAITNSGNYLVYCKF